MKLASPIIIAIQVNTVVTTVPGRAYLFNLLSSESPLEVLDYFLQECHKVLGLADISRNCLLLTC
jgi:hypothetical protein